MGNIEPYFKIDEFGRDICKLHSNYDKISVLSKQKNPIRNFDLMLTCKTCMEYLNDNCYFPKSAIDQIEHDRTKTKAFRCKLCGNRIDRMWTVIYKLYYKEKLHVEFPLVCCSCSESMKKKDFMAQYKKKALYIKYYLIMSIIIIVDNLLFLNPIYLIFSIINIVLAIFSVYFYGNYLRKLKDGKNFYEKFFSNKGDNRKNIE